jgi:hypothetical protein
MLEFVVVATKRTDPMPGTEILNIDLNVSYAEFLSLTKHLNKPYRARFEPPGEAAFEHNVGFSTGVQPTASARITLRNYKGEVPEGTRVTLLE